MQGIEVFADGKDRIDVAGILATLALMELNVPFVNMMTFEQKTTCGTVHCFAGFNNVLNGKPNKPAAKAADHAMYSLGLTLEEAERLFYVKDWPKALHARLRSSHSGSIEYFNTVKERWLHFLKTGE